MAKLPKPPPQTPEEIALAVKALIKQWDKLLSKDSLMGNLAAGTRRDAAGAISGVSAGAQSEAKGVSTYTENQMKALAEKQSKMSLPELLGEALANQNKKIAYSRMGGRNAVGKSAARVTKRNVNNAERAAERAANKLKGK